MRKILSILVLLSLTFPVFFTQAATRAATCEEYCEDPANKQPPEHVICICNPLKAKTFKELADNIIDFLFYIAIAVAPVLIIIAGIMFVTALGEPEKIATAKRIILYTVIGFAIIMLAKGLVAALEAFLGG